MMRKCEQFEGFDQHRSRIHSRLEDVCLHLGGPFRQAASTTALKNAIAHFASIVFRLYQHLNASFAKSCLSAASVPRLNKGMAVNFHSDVDRLMEMFDLNMSEPRHEWKAEYLAEDAIDAQQTEEAEDAEAIETFGSPYGRVLPPPRLHPESGLSRHTLPSWFLSPHEIETMSELSRGAFGNVHIGKWLQTRVVVKRAFIETENTDTVLTQFRQEADVWFELNHINIVKMFGACHVNDPFFVCEFASGGELNSYLRQKGWSSNLIWSSLLDAALGVQYLHANDVVHADLKGNNILVGADGIAKLTDFGLSSSRWTRGNMDGGALGAYRWKAPECLRGEPATFASDVYSFAMCIIEIVSGEIPWGRSIPDDVVKLHVRHGKLLDQPSELDDSEWRLIEHMCCTDPSERVTIDTVAVHLTSLVERLSRSELHPPIPDQVATVPHKNRLIARSGALLALIPLAESTNKHLAKCAADHLLVVHVSREWRSEQREIEAILAVLTGGSEIAKTWAAVALTDMSWNSPKNKALIAAAGGVPVLVALLRDGTDAQSEKTVQVLLNMARIDCDIASAGGIIPLVALVQSGSDAQKEKAAGALANLACKNANAKVTIASAGAIPALVALIRDGNDAQKTNAAAALRNLAVNKQNKALIVASDAVDLLVELAEHGTSEQQENASGVLWNLAY